MPAELRRLVEEELAAGNEIAEVGHSFPAAPVGCYVKLTRPVSSRPRASSEGIKFFDRNSSIYSGEFADLNRHFFVIEPPNPPPPEPDMNAIRAAAQPKGQPLTVSVTPMPPAIVAGSTLDRFQRSMVIDYEKWHDGIGYDLEIIRNATPEERAEIEQLLLSRAISDWRDVEALALIDSPRAQTALKKTLRHSDIRVRTSVLDYAPHLVPDDERTAALVTALQSAEFYGGLTQALDHVEEFHPPEVLDALLRGVLNRAGDVAVHFAAMLMFLHGKANEAFDWDQRSFFLEFNTDDGAERRKRFRELCERIGINAEEMIGKFDK